MVINFKKNSTIAIILSTCTFQVLLKARRMDNPLEFSLVEETSVQDSLPQTGSRSSFFGGSSKHSKPHTIRRILNESELVYPVQTNWKTTGRFLLERKEIVGEKVKSPFHIKFSKKNITIAKSITIRRIINS